MASAVECARLARGADRPAPRIVGESIAIQRLRLRIEAVSRRASTVLILGESGTGKELVARSIHAAGPRAAGPFVPVDCTTLHDTLFESQLFGYVKGAFTGAEQSTLGLFRAADGGTLFLDEIGELAPHLQAKLLRCIQDSAVLPLGGVRSVPVDVRIIAATHRDLEALVREGKFRADLYFRLNVVRIDVPPLRARRGDIPALAQAFLDDQKRQYQEPARRLSPEAMEALLAYDWPGNVRELANAIEHACALATGDVLTRDDLPAPMRLAPAAQRQVSRMTDAPREEDEILPLEVAERLLIARALRATGGNQARTAQLLRIERHRLYRKIRHHGLRALAGSRQN